MLIAATIMTSIASHYMLPAYQLPSPGAVSRMAQDSEKSAGSGQVLGVDISESLIGRARALAPQGTPALFQVANASSAELPEGAFDILFSRFGVMSSDSKFPSRRTRKWKRCGMPSQSLTATGLRRTFSKWVSPARAATSILKQLVHSRRSTPSFDP